MEKAKEFILLFFSKEAECWTKSESGDLDSFNTSVRELYSMAVDDLDEALGIIQRDELEKEDRPIVYIPRYLYKLSAYKNKIYGNVWVAYASPFSDPSIGVNVFSEGFIIAEIDSKLKIIGTMMVDKNRSTMKIKGWKKNIYNPSDLDIDNIGEFIAVQRYSEPENYDDFSLKEYLKDR